MGKEVVQLSTIEPVSVSVEDAAHLLGVSAPTVYQLIQRGGLPAFKVGSRTLGGVAALRRDRGDGPRGVLLQDIPRVCQRAVLLRGGHHHAVPAAHAGVQG